MPVNELFTVISQLSTINWIRSWMSLALMQLCIRHCTDSSHWWLATRAVPPPKIKRPNFHGSIWMLIFVNLMLWLVISQVVTHNCAHARFCQSVHCLHLISALKSSHWATKAGNQLNHEDSHANNFLEVYGNCCHNNGIVTNFNSLNAKRIIELFLYCYCMTGTFHAWVLGQDYFQSLWDRDDLYRNQTKILSLKRYLPPTDTNCSFVSCSRIHNNDNNKNNDSNHNINNYSTPYNQ